MSGGFVFGRGSNVLEYWLANAEGFAVRSHGSRLGVVRGVVIDPRRGRASALIVRSPVLGRRRVVLAGAVAAVDPTERVLELEPQEQPGPSRLETLRRWSDELDRRADLAGAWLRPRLHGWALALVAFVRSLRPDGDPADLHDRYPQPRARSRVRVGARLGSGRRAPAARPSRRRP